MNTIKDEMTAERIDMIIDSIPESKVGDVLARWKVLIPSQCLCWRDAIGFALSSDNKFAEMDDSYAVEKLIIGPDIIMVDRTPLDALEFCIKSSEGIDISLIRQIMQRKLRCPDMYKSVPGWLESVAMYEVLVSIDQAHEFIDAVHVWIQENMEYLK